MLGAVSHGAEPAHLDALLLVGLAIAGGALGARLFKLIRIPQVVGYIVIGLIVGRSWLRLIDKETLDALEPFNFFALGLIGFHIGGSLKVGTFRKYGRQFGVILVAQGLAAALVVGAVTFAAAWWGTGDARLAGAAALVLGSIASATAPAATVDVLRECRARGTLTTTILAIVALDDALAVALFAVAVSLAKGFLGGDVDPVKMLLLPVREIGLGAMLGGVFGLALAAVIRRVPEKDAELAVTIGAVLVAIGLSDLIGADPLMPAMVLGFTVANLAPAPAAEALELTERFARPVFVLFFVMAGARLEIGGLDRWMWVVAGAYVAGRLAGKTLGAWLGAVLSRAPRVLRRYLGLCLASQAGVAVGFSILAAARLSDADPATGALVGEAVIAVVAATVLAFEIVGPAMVKFAVVRSGEAGRGTSEEDLIRSRTVGDMMNRDPPTFHESTPLSEILHAFSRHDCFAFPVVDDAGGLRGLVAAAEIRDALAIEGLEGRVLAVDLMEPVRFKVEPGMPLHEALEKMRKAGVEAAPAVFHEDETRLAGMLEAAAVRRAVTAEVLRLHAGEK